MAHAQVEAGEHQHVSMHVESVLMMMYVLEQLETVLEDVSMATKERNVIKPCASKTVVPASVLHPISVELVVTST
jgi:hypothetical protein